ncbi:BrnT family toxin [Pseudidiomarina mangrovi]|uniref:BrnT family toxin n=1 Tax=Pseudidiomarina mangrovi TaxID=2487133 RepID=UPI000FCB1558|nr:BrnT family toxin [Pseudidiomarina mangrovi]
MHIVEFDNDKSQANLEKHGISFRDAQALWDEPRYLVIGLIGSKHWSTVITYRGKKIRLISVRRSRKREVELYES